MTTLTASDRIPVRTLRRPSAGQDNLSALLTLARRRLALSASNPREIFVPLLTPLLFALVIAPALQRWCAARPDWITGPTSRSAPRAYSYRWHACSPALALLSTGK